MAWPMLADERAPERDKPRWYWLFKHMPDPIWEWWYQRVLERGEEKPERIIGLSGRQPPNPPPPPVARTTPPPAPPAPRLDSLEIAQNFLRAQGYTDHQVTDATRRVLRKRLIKGVKTAFGSAPSEHEHAARMRNIDCELDIERERKEFEKGLRKAMSVPESVMGLRHATRELEAQTEDLRSFLNKNGVDTRDKTCFLCGERFTKHSPRVKVKDPYGRFNCVCQDCHFIYRQEIDKP